MAVIMRVYHCASFDCTNHEACPLMKIYCQSTGVYSSCGVIALIPGFIFTKMCSKRLAVIITTSIAAVFILFILRRRISHHLPSTVAIYDAGNPVPDITNDVVLPESQHFLPVHIVRFYKVTPTKDTHSFCWLECISILSILMYIRPSKIYIHTNHPDFWPFERCHMITDYSLMQFVYTRRRHILGAGKHIKAVAHEADFVKYSIAYKYGGIVTDIDVFYLPKIIPLLQQWKDGKYECLLTGDNRHTLLNSGFITCRKGHPYIRDILTVYRDDFREDPPNGWLYNSGNVPLAVYSNNPEYQKNFFVERHMGNHSSGHLGFVPYRDVPAWHSYYYSCEDNATNTLRLAVNSSFYEMVHYIAAEGMKMFPYTTPPSTRTTIRSNRLATQSTKKQ
ncbi:uncharacterized protein LOC129589824 [Paramacrobiotus metropolitanus]|uniref:uncharacterized protein LOC129589824 n=1 Tax=Paramacrobiotus metropolitanus TaxID=2943436 RepID=UPI002445CEB3|nr:uncharacterized protein LOC129589824 [Paramacrobiotus metropolitanus]